MGSSPVTVTYPSDFAPASSKEYLDIQATIECGFTLKRARDMTRTKSDKIVAECKGSMGRNLKKAIYVLAPGPERTFYFYCIVVAKLLRCSVLSYADIDMIMYIRFMNCSGELDCKFWKRNPSSLFSYYKRLT